MSMGDWSVYNNGFDGLSFLYEATGSTVSACYAHASACEVLYGHVTFVAVPAGFASCGAVVHDGPALDLAYTEGDSAGIYINLVPSALSNGFQCGLTLAEFEEFVGYNALGSQNADPGVMNFGLVCLQSQSNLSQSAGQAYALQMDSIGSGGYYRLIAMSQGISPSIGGAAGTTYVQLAATDSDKWGLNTKHRMALFWFSDPYFLDGTWLTAWAGSWPTTFPSLGATISLNTSDLSTFPFASSTWQLHHAGPGAIATQISRGEGIYACGMTNTAMIIVRNMFTYKFTVSSINGVSYPPS
jgi:hypothetical protein